MGDGAHQPFRRASRPGTQVRTGLTCIRSRTAARIVGKGENDPACIHKRVAVDRQRSLSDSKNSFQFMLAVKFNFVRIPNFCAELIYSDFVNFIEV